MTNTHDNQQSDQSKANSVVDNSTVSEKSEHAVNITSDKPVDVSSQSTDQAVVQAQTQAGAEQAQNAVAAAEKADSAKTAKKSPVKLIVMSIFVILVVVIIVGSTLMHSTPTGNANPIPNPEAVKKANVPTVRAPNGYHFTEGGQAKSATQKAAKVPTEHNQEIATLRAQIAEQEKINQRAAMLQNTSQNGLHQLQNAIGNIEQRLHQKHVDLAAVKSDVAALRSSIDAFKDNTLDQLSSFNNALSQAMNVIAANQAQMKAQLQKMMALKTHKTCLGTKALPFMISAFNLINGTPVISVQYDNFTTPINVGGSLAGWHLVKADYGTQTFQFTNNQDQCVDGHLNGG